MRRVGFACGIPTAADVHSEYVALLAFIRHQWLRKRVLMLRFIRSWRVLHFYVCMYVCMYVVLKVH